MWAFLSLHAAFVSGKVLIYVALLREIRFSYFLVGDFHFFFSLFFTKKITKRPELNPKTLTMVVWNDMSVRMISMASPWE